MKLSDIPAKFNIPFASAAGGGYVRTVPEASQQSITPGAASLTDGFPPLTFQPVGAGGIPPFGQDFNGILKQITQWSRWQGAGGTPNYDSAFATAVGGYPKWAVVAGSSAGVLWLCLVDDNTNNPDSNPTGWMQLISAQYVPQFAPANFRSLLLNGGFTVNQRAFAGGSLTNGTYGYDRWKAASGGTSISVSGTVVTLLGTIRQVLESPDIASQVVTLSAESPSQPLAVSVGGVTGTIPAGLGRQSVTLTLGAGVTGNVNVDVTASISTTFQKLQMLVGSYPSPWRWLAPGEETRLCQRYYVTFVPGVVSGRLGTGQLLDSGEFHVSISLPNIIRDPSTMTVTQGNLVRVVTATVDITGFNAANVYQNVFSIRFTSGTVTGGPYAGLLQTKTTAGFLTIDNEL